MNKSDEKELNSTLHFINNLVSDTYSCVYENAKNMSKEQLLDLLATNFASTLKKENDLLVAIAKTENLGLARKYADTSKEYINEIDKKMDQLVAQNRIEPEISENALPGDAIK